MKIFKKLSLTPAEIKELFRKTEGYLWVILDTRRGCICAGDEYVADLRDALIIRRSKLGDLYGVGIDLSTGKVDHLPVVNRRNPNAPSGFPDDDSVVRIETLLRYFFANIPCFHGDASALCFSSQRTGLQAVLTAGLKRKDIIKLSHKEVRPL